MADSIRMRCRVLTVDSTTKANVTAMKQTIGHQGIVVMVPLATAAVHANIAPNRQLRPTPTHASSALTGDSDRTRASAESESQSGLSGTFTMPGMWRASSPTLSAPPPIMSDITLLMTGMPSQFATLGTPHRSGTP